jgi:hypothetical protein
MEIRFVDRARDLEKTRRCLVEHQGFHKNNKCLRIFTGTLSGIVHGFFSEQLHRPLVTSQPSLSCRLSRCTLIPKRTDDTPGDRTMTVFNRRQRLTMGVIALLFLLLGLFPPWRLADGRFLGLHPAWSPPPAVPDSLPAPQPRHEYLPIQIVPQSLYRGPSNAPVDETMLRRPYLAIRMMLAAGTFLFLGGIVIVLLLRDRTRRDQLHLSNPIGGTSEPE